MYDFDRLKKDILGRVDLLQTVSEHVALKRRGQSWVGLCPFHSEKTPSFTVRPDVGFFKCFGCGQSGDLFSFIQLKENVSFGEALRMLADRAGVDIAPSRGDQRAGGSGRREPGRSELAKVNAWAARYFRSVLLDPSVGRSALAYVSGRNISPETAERFELGLATGAPGRLEAAAKRAGFDAELLLAADLLRRGERGDRYDTFRNRLMFPIRDATKRVVGFGGRTLADDSAKYLNTRQNALFDKGKGLYGIDLARSAITERTRSILVEGYTDCIAAHQAGFTETVATLGTALTPSQVDLLRRYADHIILLFDSDQAGEAAAERAIRVALPRCVHVRLACISDGKDPSDLLCHAGSTAFSDLLNAAVDALEFKWLATRRRYQTDGSDRVRREAILDFLGVVAEACRGGAVDATQRGLLVNQVSQLLQTDAAQVNHDLRRLERRRDTAEHGASGAGPADASDSVEQRAWMLLLEAALNDPSLLRGEDALPVFDRIARTTDRTIACALLDPAFDAGQDTRGALLAAFDDGDTKKRIVELFTRGERRGNFKNTFHSALDKIREVIADDEMLCTKRELRDSPDRIAEYHARIVPNIRQRRDMPRIPLRLKGGVAASVGEPPGADIIETTERP